MIVSATLSECQMSRENCMSEVNTVLSLILVMPATNAISERSFSSLRRIKNYLRSTMTQERMNNIMILNVHKERTKELDRVKIANDFVQGSPHRKQILALLYENFFWVDIMNSNSLIYIL